MVRCYWVCFVCEMFLPINATANALRMHATKTTTKRKLGL